MRPIGYVAATVAGMITPIALALPALAGTQSPIFSGMNNIVSAAHSDGVDDGGSGCGPDGGPGCGPDGGSGCGPDGGSGCGPDGGPGYGPNGGLGYGGEAPAVRVFATGSEATGNVALVVSVDGADPLHEYILSSPSLNSGCEFNNLNGAVAETDRFGHLNITAEGSNCVPGPYQIAVAKNEPGELTYYGTVNVY